MTWLAICDRCGFQKKSDQLRKEWTGLMVCSDGCWEPRHPQDSVRGVVDRQAPPWVRPEPADVFSAPSCITYLDGSLILLVEDNPLSFTPDALGAVEP